MTTILATGGLGFIGSHTSLVLLKEGYDVVIVDSLINSSKSVIEGIKKTLSNDGPKKLGKLYFREGDIREYKFLKSIFQEFKVTQNPIDAVIHFAGLKSVINSLEKPLNYWDVNVNGSINLLGIMNEFNCYKFVFSSSATIYKSDSPAKISENHYLKPINPYGNTKLTIEKILDDLCFSEDKKWKVANLRYFNPAGAHPLGLIGEKPKTDSTNLFPMILKVLDKKLEFLSIFGNDWPTKDGTCVRDFIHVMDLAEAHYLSLEYLNKNEPQNIKLNVGTGEGFSVLEVVNIFKEVLNLEIKIKFAERRNGDYPYVVADNSLALSLLNWQPKRKLKDMCRDVWKSHLIN